LATFVYHEKNSVLQVVAYGIIFIAVLVFNSHHIFAIRKKYSPMQKRPIVHNKWREF
jgi:chloramphenicol-sensitive protein RarD